MPHVANSLVLGKLCTSYMRNGSKTSNSSRSPAPHTRSSVAYAAFRAVVALVMLAGLAFGLANCANSNLICVEGVCQPAGAKGLDNKVEFKGTYCSANPNAITTNYRVLFIVDVSGSTTTSDPQNQRGPAVQAAIDSFANNPQVTFAIESFEASAHVLVGNFTKDPTILTPATIAQVNANLGSTDYVAALQAAQGIIATDANAMTATERARTVYNIQWLSDGSPNPCVAIASILAAEQDILNLVQTYNMLGLTFSTTFLTGADSGQSCNASDPNETPTGVMTDMANEGGGSFQALNGSNIKFNIDLGTFLQPFNSHLFYVVNHSRVVKNGLLLADSDQDGVSDEDETTKGTDPLNADSYKTGCSDGVNATTELASNPNSCAARCSTELTNVGGDPNKLLDEDADGIHDCEETALTSNKLLSDTDQDNLIDSIEVRFNTDYGDKDTFSRDSDSDGVTDGTEVVQGTDPLTPEPDRSLAYVYSPVTRVASTIPGTTCYSFDVTNVQLVQTQATASTQAGDNELCLYIEQLPQGTSSNSSLPTVTKTCSVANYKVQNNVAIMSPPSGSFSIDPNQFTPTICNGAGCDK